VNATFFNPTPSNPTPPVFFYIEGEGAGNAADVVEGQHVELAAAHGALILALEHRYYGASVPTPDMTTPNMRFLSSHQAIADIARFIAEYVYPTFNITAENKLVTFGGSYPGALSAWARLRLPHMVYGAFSTSSPVNAIADFQGYNNVVAAALANPAVGGSSACLGNVQQAFSAVTAAFQGTLQQKTAMSTKLSSCAPATAALDIANAVSNVAGAIMGVVQYNNDQPGGYTVADICATMTQAGNAVDNLAQVVVATLDGASCMDNSYADLLAQLRNTTVDRSSGGVGMRQWTYQTCTQFGYYQTCDANTNCPFSTLMTLEFSFQQCQDAFGISATTNVDRINFTNDILGGYNVGESTDRIIFTNGGVDPWHMLSVTPANINNPQNAALFIPTGAHCRQMFPSSPNDPADVKAARAQAANILSQWLTQ
jgi:serine protease 16